MGRQGGSHPRLKGTVLGQNPRLEGAKCGLDKLCPSGRRWLEGYHVKVFFVLVHEFRMTGEDSGHLLDGPTEGLPGCSADNGTEDHCHRHEVVEAFDPEAKSSGQVWLEAGVAVGSFDVGGGNVDVSVGVGGSQIV